MEFKRAAKGIRYALDDDVLKNSTSGGVFVALALNIINQGGCVYGAAYDENNVVRHIRVNKSEDIFRLQGSKYVQSKLGDCFKNVRKDLENGILVLFSGTPCQSAGVKAFLSSKYDNLLVMDFTCHGVPSPFFFKKYLVWLEKKYGESIKSGDYIFRVKKHGWYYRRHMSYTMKVGSHYRYVGTDPYYSNFLKGSDYRESCYTCPFKMDKDVADITVGDFNGVDIAYPDFFDKRGVSYAIMNTEKGRNFIKAIEKTTHSIDVDYSVLVKYNKTLVQPIVRPKARTEFYANIGDSNFVAMKNQEIPIKSRIKPLLPYFVEKWMKG